MTDLCWAVEIVFDLIEGYLGWPRRRDASYRSNLESRLCLAGRESSPEMR
jgi:hypothetical protein